MIRPYAPSGMPMSDLGFALPDNTTYIRSPLSDYGTAYGGTLTLSRANSFIPVSFSTNITNFGDGPAIFTGIRWDTIAIPSGGSLSWFIRSGTIPINSTTPIVIAPKETIDFAYTYSGPDGIIRGDLFFLGSKGLNTREPFSVVNIRTNVVTSI